MAVLSQRPKEGRQPLVRSYSPAKEIGAFFVDNGRDFFLVLDTTHGTFDDLCFLMFLVRERARGAWFQNLRKSCISYRTC